MPKYVRDLSSYSDEDKVIYQTLYDETRQLFSERAEKVTVIHDTMIDRFVSTYIDLLSLDKVTTVSEKKYKTIQDKFQSWSKSILDALNAAALEREGRQIFYEKVVQILTEEIPDDKLRKRIFERVLDEAVRK